jgi:hypothetical protein
LSEDPRIYLGFCVYAGPILHYIYVHQDQRRHGIARSLLPQGIEAFTDITRTGKVIWKDKYHKWRFNPYL